MKALAVGGALLPFVGYGIRWLSIQFDPALPYGVVFSTSIQEATAIGVLHTALSMPVVLLLFWFARTVSNEVPFHRDVEDRLAEAQRGVDISSARLPELRARAEELRVRREALHRELEVADRERLAAISREIELMAADSDAFGKELEDLGVAADERHAKLEEVRAALESRLPRGRLNRASAALYGFGRHRWVRFTMGIVVTVGLGWLLVGVVSAPVGIISNLLGGAIVVWVSRLSERTAPITLAHLLRPLAAYLLLVTIGAGLQAQQAIVANFEFHGAVLADGRYAELARTDQNVFLRSCDAEGPVFLAAADEIRRVTYEQRPRIVTSPTLVGVLRGQRVRLGLITDCTET